MTLTIPIATAGADSIKGIGTMMMRGLGGIRAGNVATSTQMAGSVNSTRSGNGGANKDGVRLKGWVAGVWIVLLFNALTISNLWQD